MLRPEKGEFLHSRNVFFKTHLLELVESCMEGPIFKNTITRNLKEWPETVLVFTFEPFDKFSALNSIVADSLVSTILFVHPPSVHRDPSG